MVTGLRDAWRPACALRGDGPVAGMAAGLRGMATRLRDAARRDRTMKGGEAAGSRADGAVG
ncbi:hypothetical protein SBD_3800 [Streptomyces bottropensis ATCC 25435]|uniref:Uncharacterized protein n=1 Tax=Streptomyces bottropensis ATCC 25435 TaxID=1054862 RepID=M3EY29_9ACTN|nr:hypothetical protein SBD_3800 [Streptomyces bottropensis ATCC 25435]